MTATSLRAGFLISGLLHVAIVAAFSQSSRQPVPAVDEPRPLSLKLSAFRPPAPTPEKQPPSESPSQEMAVQEPEPPAAEPPPDSKPPPVEKHVEIAPPPKPEPIRPVEAEPPRPKPESKVVRKPRPKPKKKRPLEVKPAAPTPVIVAEKTVERPRPPAIDLQRRQHYLAALAAKINRSKFYPRASRRRGEEGTVVVSFVIQRGGALTDLAVTESSGHQRLDKAALKTLRKVTPFKPIPAAVKRDHWPITVPIKFSLGG